MKCLNLRNLILNLKTPFGMIISGPSGSGKTTFLMRFMKEIQSLINPPQNPSYIATVNTMIIFLQCKMEEFKFTKEFPMKICLILL